MNPSGRRRFITKITDRAAGWGIAAGGLLMIGGLILIFLLIFAETLPLFRTPSSTVRRAIPVPEASPLSIAPDEYRNQAEALFRSGRFLELDLATGRIRRELPLPVDGATVTAAARSVRGDLVLGLSNGSALLVSPRWKTVFEGNRRVNDLDVPAVAPVRLDPARRPLGLVSSSKREGGTAIAGMPDPAVLLYAWRPEDGETVVRDLSAGLGGERVTALAFYGIAGEFLVAGTGSGRLLTFSLDTPGKPAFLESFDIHPGAPAPVTALAPLLGGVKLIVGDAKGRVVGVVRNRESDASEARRTIVANRYASHSSPVTAIAASPRGKAFLAGDSAGDVTVSFGTNERTLFRQQLGAPITALAFAPKGDGFVAIAGDRLVDITMDAPHPEVSFRALFGKVLYEGQDRPEYTWQSTGGTDDFEAKLSLVPLVFGTLKGTLYAMLFAVPIALAAALYTSVFATPRLKSAIKPVVEVMAALPSVVLGFLAGLWLAPLVQRATLSTLLLFPVLPLVLLVAVFLFQLLPRAVRLRFRGGREFLLIVPLVLLGIVLCGQLGPLLERLAFGGDFKAWLLSSSGLKYDARNSIVIAFAMGFAVIPIIYTISEDALSSVPGHLKAASLALGASPWQTAIRVILPTASAGIFSAVMVGFGRAVGETMIVLMATGNTPIMEWSVFNGMRTLSANIAVEISEAPFGGTLYRVLFLAALLLFLMTFAVNTIAEVLRQRLRRKYSVI